MDIKDSTESTKNDHEPTKINHVKRLSLVIIAVFFTLLAVSFLQQRQEIRQRAQTTPVSPAACSNVQYYCLINGGNTGSCNVPSVCPSPSVACVPAGPIPAKLIVHFDFALFNIKNVDSPALDNYVAELKKNPYAVVTIAGHTDSLGAEKLNKTLSLDRANAVKSYLVSKGATTNQYKVIGYGETKPIAPNTNPNGTDNPAGRALNRRVEITATLPSNTCPVVSGQPVVAPASASATTNNCNNKYDITKNPLGLNFGDPSCNFDKNTLYTLLKQQTPADADKWYNIIIPCLSGFNPDLYRTCKTQNATNCVGTDPMGSWGLFQMGRGANGADDHGDVDWHQQLANALAYNTILKSAGKGFNYWGACSQPFWNSR